MKESPWFYAAAAVSGFVMAVGISFSGMTSVYKSLAFFDMAGHTFGGWDPSLGVTFCIALAIVFSLWGKLTSSVCVLSFPLPLL
jgi:uncharacterized membrane protein YedE/YeeE